MTRGRLSVGRQTVIHRTSLMASADSAGDLDIQQSALCGRSASDVDPLAEIPEYRPT
jgi:hypothetical protein